MYVQSAKCTEAKKKEYNNGNVNFELIVKDNTKFEVYGTISKKLTLPPEDCTIAESYTKIGRKLGNMKQILTPYLLYFLHFHDISNNRFYKISVIEAVMKNKLKLFKNQEIEYWVGAITDCSNKLEIKCNLNCAQLQIEKGILVKVTGTMERYPPGPPMLKIEELEDIKKVDNDRIEFKDIYAGFRNTA